MHTNELETAYLSARVAPRVPHVEIVLLTDRSGVARFTKREALAFAVTLAEALRDNVMPTYIAADGHVPPTAPLPWYARPVFAYPIATVGLVLLLCACILL